MSMLSAVLFIHVMSAMSLFAALALEAPALLQIRASENADQADAGLRAFLRLRGLGIPAYLGLLVGGGYLAFQYGSWAPWISLSLLATVVLMLVGGFVTGIRMVRLQKLVSAADQTTFGVVSTRTRDRALVLSYGFRVGLAIGVVFLMTVQPELTTSVIALAATALAGALLAARLTQHATRPGVTPPVI